MYHEHDAYVLKLEASKATCKHTLVHARMHAHARTRKDRWRTVYFGDNRNALLFIGLAGIWSRVYVR